MTKTASHIIYTIGHSTRSTKEFLEMLHSFDIKILGDIRQMPGSRMFPQFDQENLKNELEKSGIQYIYLSNLGGRRKAIKNSKNTRWNNMSFRGYADCRIRKNSIKPEYSYNVFGSCLVEVSSLYDIRLFKSKKLECLPHNGN